MQNRKKTEPACDTLGTRNGARANAQGTAARGEAARERPWWGGWPCPRWLCAPTTACPHCASRAMWHSSRETVASEVAPTLPGSRHPLSPSQRACHPAPRPLGVQIIHRFTVHLGSKVMPTDRKVFYHAVKDEGDVFFPLR